MKAIHISSKIVKKSAKTQKLILANFESNSLHLNLISDEAQFIKGSKGGPILVDKAGYIYYKAKNSKSDSKKIFWRCHRKRHQKYFCSARATTVGFHIVKYLNEHDHKPEKIFGTEEK